MWNRNIIVYLFLVLFSSTVFSSVFKGKLEVLIFDDFENQKSKIMYKLNDYDTSYILELPKTIDRAKLITGMSVVVEGKASTYHAANKPAIKVDSINIISDSSKEALATNERKIITLLVDFTDKQATDTISINDVNTIMYASNNSMEINLKRSSFNQISVIPDTNKDGVADIYTVNLNYAAGVSCSYKQWANDATNAAKALGLDTSLYQHLMFVLPRDVNCSWGGLGHVGCSDDTCNTWVKAYPASGVYTKVVYVHEIGHNLGMYHSATDTNNDGTVENEYGDAACFMGTGGYNSLKELNAPHRDQLKLFAAYPQSLKTITGNGSYSLSPLESSVINNNLLALKFFKQDSSEYYYLSYRRNIGPFGAGATEYLNKVSVHKATTRETYFIKALAANESFIDEKNNIKVTVLSLDESKANVQVNIGPVTEELKAYTFFNNDNTREVGYGDWDWGFWKGNCPAYAETVGLSASPANKRPNAVACLIKDGTTSTASGDFVKALGGVNSDVRSYARNGDWDRNYYKWECGLNEYVSGFSQDTTSYGLHKIRCAKGVFTNSGKNFCETRSVSDGKDDRGSNEGGDWDNKYYKAQCSPGKLIFGVSVDVLSHKPHKILCCNK